MKKAVDHRRRFHIQSLQLNSAGAGTLDISTRNLAALPDIAGLKRLLQSMAMLDAILEAEWEHRYYSFNAHWSRGEMMGSMRNGHGDEFYALFNDHGAFLKGFVHDSLVTSFGAANDSFYCDLPRQFEPYTREPAFSTEQVTFCIWRCIGDRAWSCSKPVSPNFIDADGSSYLLSMLDGIPQTYATWAKDYYECDVGLEAVQAIYEHRILTDDLVVTLKPSRSLRSLESDIAEIGYPAVAAMNVNAPVHLV